VSGSGCERKYAHPQRKPMTLRAFLFAACLCPRPSTCTAAPRPPSYVGLRSRTGPHSGSDWFASLLASVGIKTFFQYEGDCPIRKPGVNPIPMAGPVKTYATPDTIRALLRNGCKCPVPPANDPHDQVNSKYAYCQGRCNNTCSLPVVVIPRAGLQWEMSVLVATTDNVPAITWERENSVKHAVSQLKSPCSLGALANHAKLWQRPHEDPPPALVLLDPRSIIIKATRNQQTRMELREVVPRVAHAAAYEAFQLDTDKSMSELLADILPDGTTSGSSSEPSSVLVKRVGESLATLLLGFRAVNASFAPWPCLQRQLYSAVVERFPTPCANEQLPRQDELENLELEGLELEDLELFASADFNLGVHREQDTATIQCGMGGPEDKTVICRAAMDQAGTGRVDVCVPTSNDLAVWLSPPAFPIP